MSAAFHTVSVGYRCRSSAEILHISAGSGRSLPGCCGILRSISGGIFLLRRLRMHTVSDSGRVVYRRISGIRQTACSICMRNVLHRVLRRHILSGNRVLISCSISDRLIAGSPGCLPVLGILSLRGRISGRLLSG